MKKLEPALGLSGQPVKRGTMAHEHIVYMMLVDAAVTALDRDGILKYAPLLEELARRDDHQPYLAICLRAYGIAHMLAGEHEQAEERLQQALQIFEELEMTWQRGRTLYQLGELAQLGGNNELAWESFSKAMEDFELMQAKPDSARTKEAIGTILSN